MIRRSSAALASAIRHSSAARHSAFAILFAFAFFNSTYMRVMASSSGDIFFGGEDGLQHCATALIYVENSNSDNAYFGSASRDHVTRLYWTSAIINSNIRPYDLGGSVVEGRYC